MRHVMRYLLPFKFGIRTSVRMPAGGVIRSARMGVVTGMVELHYELPKNTFSPMEPRNFWITATGYEVPDRFPTFVQTVYDGPYAWHIYTT
jgi:hypothetical protein